MVGGSLPPLPQGALSSLQQRSTQEVEERRAELKQTRERLHKEIDGVLTTSADLHVMCLC